MLYTSRFYYSCLQAESKFLTRTLNASHNPIFALLYFTFCRYGR
ncbi:hypothetical protein MGSAQ_001094 [marine sediment metagenome]|uniref:Uncharacterized protein n=1 Tax=marine sediment metagenome TaxID=412755 RepID=A0A1B6NVE8_9ZZZZ